MKEIKLSLGKKILCIILAVVVLIVGGLSVYLIITNTGSKFSDKDAKTAVLESSKLLDKTGEALKTGNSNAVTSKNLDSLVNNAIMKSQFEPANNEDLYMTTVLQSQLYMSMAEYLVKSDYKFGEVIKDNSDSESRTQYFCVEKLKSSVKIDYACDDSDFTSYAVYYIDYDVKANSV